MSVSRYIEESMKASSWIRKMFEEGTKLKAQYGEDKVYDFTLGNPDVEPPEMFFKVLKETVMRSKKGAHAYMPNAGYPDVREKISLKASKEQGVPIPMENVIMTCGAAGALNTVLKTILNAGDEVIVPRPYFVEYGFYIANHGGKMVLADSLPDFSLDIKNISRAINDKTRAVLINSPNNPTGRVYPEHQIRELSDLINSKNKNGQLIYLISDEPYRDIVYNNITVPGIMNYCDQSIVVTSFSKSLSLPGERIGYCAVNPRCSNVKMLMDGLILCNRILGYVNAPALMQRVVAELGNVTVDVAPYAKRKDMLTAGLLDAGYEFPEPEGAFYIFCKAPGGDDVVFVQHLQKYNILGVPGVGFGGPGFFRITYCVAEKTIQNALPVFKKAMEEF